MPDLFGNTQLPPWMQTPSGAVLAQQDERDYNQKVQNFAQLAQIGMQRQKQDALLPLQVQEQKNQLQSQALDWQMKQFQTENMLNAKSGVVDLSSILATTKDWTNPSEVGRFWEAVKNNPSVALTPQGQSLIKSAEALQLSANGAAAKIDQANIRAQSAEDVANIRKAALDARTAELAESNRVSNETKIELQKQKFVNDLTRSPGYDVLPHAQGKLFQAEIDKLKADPTLTFPQFQRASESLLERWSEKYGVKGRETANPQAGDAPSASTAPAFKTQDDVVQAYKSGKIPYKDAATILKNQFGVQ